MKNLPLRYLKYKFLPLAIYLIEIANLNSSKAVGPFSILLHVLKLLKGVIFKPLQSIFNASFTTGIVSNKFKMGNIIPVYKNGSCNIKSNYRPISLLSIFNKIKKTSFVIFHSLQKRITTQISLLIHNFPIKQEYCIKYLGILIDSNLNWKSHIGYVAKKMKRSVGILSKLQCFTNIHILKKLYHALIQPFLVYGIIV